MSQKYDYIIIGSGIIGLSIAKAIKASDKTSADLARATGLSEAALSKFLNHDRDLFLDSAHRLADALGLELVIQPKRRKR